MIFPSDSYSAGEQAGRVVMFHSDDSLWPMLVDAANDQRAQPMRCQAAEDCVAMLRVDQPTCGVIEPASLLANPELLRPLAESPNATAVVFVGADDAGAGDLLQPVVVHTLGPAPEAGELREAIRVGLDNARVSTDDRQLVRNFHQRLKTLTRDEKGVFEAVCKGKLNKQIAREFNVSLRTIEQRRRRVFEKMGVQSAVPLAAQQAMVETLLRLLPSLKAMTA